MENLGKLFENARILLFIQNFLNNSRTFHQKEIICSVISLRNEYFIKYTNKKINKGIVDLNACVLIPMGTSLKLHIYDGNWMLAEFTSNNKITRRWIQVFVDYFTKEENVCSISNCLFSNIDLDGDITNLRLKLESFNKYHILYTLWKNIPEKYIKFESQNCKDKSASIHNATKAELCPLDLSIPDHYLYENYIKCFFQTPKFVCVGDIIEIDIPFAAGFAVNKNIYPLLPPSCLKFCVENLLGQALPECGACINSKSTELIITRKSGNPIKMKSRRKHALTSNYLSKYVNVIVRHISTYITNSFDSNNHLEVSDDSDMEEPNWCGVCLLIGPTGSGKIDVVIEAAEMLGFNLKWLDAYSMRGDTSRSTEDKIAKCLQSTFPNTFVIITNISALAKNKDGMKDPRVMEFLMEEMQKISNEDNSVYVIATSKKKTDVADEIWILFTYHEIFDTPDFDERKGIITWIARLYLEKVNLDESVINDLSHRGGGFLLGDFKELFGRIAVKLKELDESSVNINDVCTETINEMKAELSKSLNLPKIPSVSWQDIGGLDEVKKELINTIQLPILHPQLISHHLKRSGILLYGPPGTGKTMLAKSVAHECGLNFLSVKGPELLDMYVGQSEANVRDVFRKAREASPCVIFFDELDSLAPSRGRSGDSGGVMDRIVAALLTELDETGSSSQVFVLGATNRPDLLDAALLRPGRFDKQLYINVAEGREERMKLLKAVFSKVPLSKNFQFENVLDTIPGRLSGADFYSLALDSFYLAAERVITDIEEGIKNEDALVDVNEDDVIEASKTIRPSVTEEQFKQYQLLQTKFS